MSDSSRSSTVSGHRPAEAAHGNRLIHETSPYLLQHAYNPVNWYAWGPEAFEAARKQNKPIFVSIGYSTCYWCHVMERESFENEAIAAIMNEHFISIKVDREERPDVDEIYMTATQALNQGQGGWPMSVFLEPNSLKPFFAGTYFPPEDSPQLGRIGFPTLLRQMAEAWSAQREAVEEQATNVANHVSQQLMRAALPQPLGAEQVDQAIALLMDSYDQTDAGFGQGRNKFPMPANLDLLIGAAWKQSGPRQAVVHTLDRMATGGMYDQIGGGFHRYSTDRKWLVPHFEKMLYDNGQLATTYAAAHERTGNPYYAEIVREILDYVLREMTDPSGGGFYSAQDAEVNAREGGNYVWTVAQVKGLLRAAGLDSDTEFTLEVYGFNGGTNFRDPHHPEDGWKNVVYLIDRPSALARRRDLSLGAFNKRLARVNRELLAVRDTRDQPGTDDKILAGWNGLMIAGMANGARVLDEPGYLEAARRAKDFVLTTMRGSDGGLLRTYRAGEAKIDAFLEDYAFMIHGLITLHRASGDTQALEEAEELAAMARERFWDDMGGAYFDTLVGRMDLFVRTKSMYDGAVPCGNSVMLNNLLDLHELTGEAAYLDDAVRTLEGLSASIRRSPSGHVLSVLGLKRVIDGYPERLEQLAAVARSAKKPVEVMASVARLEVAADAPATFELTIRIADGYHINAHDPGLAFLIPLKLRASGGTGIEVQVDWPPGELYEGPLAQGRLAEGEMRVHTGEIKLPVRVEQVGEITGQPRLMLTYQVCTDYACLAPTTETVGVELALGKQ